MQFATKNSAINKIIGIMANVSLVSAPTLVYNEFMAKKYYSPFKEYSKVKRVHPLYKLIRGMVKLFFPKNEFVWATEEPKDGEPVVFVCNHTKIYAPTYFLLRKDTVRLWANGFFVRFKSCWSHFRDNVLFGKRKWLRPLGLILTPLVVYVFRAIEPIPVYKKTAQLMETFEKSIWTLNEGVPQVIFPERTENKVNRYVYEFQQGFPLIAEQYYKQTGKKVKFYPVYCAQPLRKVVAGDPIEYNPDIPMKLQRKQICEYLENKIAEIADSLPEHEPVIYG